MELVPSPKFQLIELVTGMVVFKKLAGSSMHTLSGPEKDGTISRKVNRFDLVSVSEHPSVLVVIRVTEKFPGVV